MFVEILRKASVSRHIDPPLSDNRSVEWWGAIAVLCVIVIVFYAQLWIPGLVLIKRDAFQFFLPLKQYIIERLSKGELPQWFPYEGLGRPLLGIPVTGVFHPFTGLYWLLPVHEAFRLSVFLSCLMGALGTYVLGRILSFSSTGAVIAAVGFSCSGYVVSLTENLVYLYSTCMLPFFLVSLEKSCATRKSSYVALSALAWASVFLNGDVQTGYYYGLIALLWIGLRPTAARWHEAMWFLPIVLTTLLLAGIQLGPAWAVFTHSDRTDPGSFHAEAIHWSTHPLRLVMLGFSPIGDDTAGDQIAQNMFGNDGSGRGPAGFWAESLYLGLPILGLAIGGAWRSRKFLVFTVLGGTGLVLALGQYGALYDLFYKWLPLWSAFRYPEKIMGIVSFAMAMLAGAGFDAIGSGRIASVFWFIVSLLCLGFSAVLHNEGLIQRLTVDFHLTSGLAHTVASSGAQAALFSAAATLGIGMLLLWRRLQPSRWRWASGVLIMIIALDLARANLPALHTAPSEAWTFTPGLVQAIRNDAKVEGPGHFRILGIKDAMAALPDHVDRALTPRERIAMIRKQGLYAEQNAAFQIESVQSYLPGGGLASQQIGRNASVRSIARFNVAYLIGRPARFDSAQFANSIVAAVPDYDLVLVRNPVPVTARAYLSRRPESLASTATRLSFLDREDFLSGEVDGIENGILPLPGPLDDGKTSILEYHPEFVRIAVDTSQPAALILADAFEPGWKANIEGGGDVQIFRANGLVRAVLVPAGRFVIDFTYETPLLRVGIWLTVVGLSISSLMFAREWRKVRVSNRSTMYRKVVRNQFTPDSQSM